MKLLRGTPISPGYAEGVAIVHRTPREVPIPRYRIEPTAVDAEHERLDAAIERAGRDLEHVRDRVLLEFGEAEAGILAVHLALLRDKHFIDKVKQRVADGLINVEQAIAAELETAAAQLAAAKDEYFKERAQDIRDVGQRLLRQLVPTGGGLMAHLPPNSILVAHELLPSDTLDLDRSHVAAIITERGGPTSHTAILARSMGVPAITGVAGALTEIEPGAKILANGESGQIIVDPSPVQSERFSGQKEQYESSAAAAMADQLKECVTLDGVRIFLYANIGRPPEAAEVARHYLDGVGLFRTEFMFMDESEPPSLERQRLAYQHVIKALGRLPLVIRTLDLGGDKMPAFLIDHCEANPGRCSRGLHFALSEGRSLLEIQLQAIMDLADTGNVRVLFPMVLGGGDLREAIGILKTVAGGRKIPPVGAMIETPASLFSLDEIMELADFASIGTNDLTQFMLAVDRNSVDLPEGSPVLHPSILRAIARIIEACKRRNKPLTVCGEAAGDPPVACLLAGLGVRELSMSPPRAARVRHTLRSVRCRDLERLAQEALRDEGIAAVHRRLAEAIPR